MFEEQQAVASYPNPNPNPLQHTTVLIPEPIGQSTGIDPYASSYPYSHGYDGLQAPPAFEVDTTGALQGGIISQTTDSTTCENAGATLSQTTTVSTIMHSAGNFGVATQHVTNDVVLTTKQNENFQTVQCEVCNLTCNSEEVLEKHKQGKKHLKNLHKQAISSVIGPKLPPAVAASAPPVRQLENKKHKLLQNGASINSLIHCDICDVLCNNQDVFQKHLAGRKHIAKATFRLASMNGLTDPTSGSSAVAQPSTGGSRKKPATVPAAWCELCKVSCTSNELLNTHLAGKKHLKKLKDLEKIPDPPLMPAENPNSTEGKVVNSHEGKPVSCELCGISCDTNDVLKTHMSGKKHQKNLENSKKLIGPNPAPGTEPPVIGPLQDSAEGEGKIVVSDKSKRKAKRPAATDEDLETKKQKVLEGGAASDALRTCILCNVVCNSPAVYLSHLAGQKHTAMAVKQAEGGSTGKEKGTLQ